MKSIIIAGTNSNSGKTTISMGLMKVFENVAGFKIGPDYIDTAFHEMITKNKSYNLDLFMTSEEILKYNFYENSKGKNFAIIEGVMGLYDGLGHSLDNYSTAHISRVLDIPVILVVNVKGISTSIAAQILGYTLFDERVQIQGIILNNCNSEKLYLHLKEAIEKFTQIECLGYLPNIKEISIESRHLGLMQNFEVEKLNEKLEILKEHILKYINLDRIFEIAKEEKEIKCEFPFPEIKDKLKGKKIAVAKDRAFSFYYNSNIDLIKYAGAEIIYFSPILDKFLPENIDFIYLGGGYPEIYSKELSENKEMISSILNAYENNTRIYAECGGFIYLSEGIKTLNKGFYEFCGIFNIKMEMTEKLNILRFGYININTKNNIKIKGHEFHYSKIYENNEKDYFYDIQKNDTRTWTCGYLKNKTLAGYPHIDFNSNIDFFKFLFKIY